MEELDFFFHDRYRPFNHCEMSPVWKWVVYTAGTSYGERSVFIYLLMSMDGCVEFRIAMGKSNLSLILFLSIYNSGKYLALIR